MKIPYSGIQTINGIDLHAIWIDASMADINRSIEWFIDHCEFNNLNSERSPISAISKFSDNPRIFRVILWSNGYVDPALLRLSI